MQSYSKKKINNILLVTSSNFPYGGASANLLRLLTNGLTKEGKSVHVIVQRGKQYGSIPTTENRSSWIGGVFYEYCGFLRRPNNYILKIVDTILGIILPVTIIIKKIFSKELDIVLIYNQSTSEKILILIACKIFGIPVINQIVEWYSKESIVGAWWKVVKWWDFLVGINYFDKYFDGMIVTSTFLKKYYISRKVKEENIFVLPNLVDLSFFEQASSLSVSTNTITRIGYCGTPTRKDGIDDLLLSFKLVYEKYKNVQLVVIGDAQGTNSLIPNLKIQAQNLTIFDSVEFTGLVDWKEMPRLLNSCDILVLARPSGKFAEAGFPTKLGEYMACRKPVVVTKVGDIPLYLKDRVNAMIADPDNPQSIADKIIELIEKPELAKEVAENGYKWADEKLNYLKVSKEVCSFIDNFRK